MKDPFENTRRALALWHLGEVARSQRTFETESDVDEYVQDCEVARLEVCTAFLEDTKHINSWSHCKVMDAWDIKRIVESWDARNQRKLDS